MFVKDIEVNQDCGNEETETYSVAGSCKIWKVFLWKMMTCKTRSPPGLPGSRDRGACPIFIHGKRQEDTCWGCVVSQKRQAAEAAEKCLKTKLLLETGPQPCIWPALWGNQVSVQGNLGASKTALSHGPCWWWNCSLSTFFWQLSWHVKPDNNSLFLLVLGTPTSKRGGERQSWSSFLSQHVRGPQVPSA